MTLAAPEWLIALVAVPILALAGWLTWRRRAKRWGRLVAPRLRSRLARERPPWVYFTTLALLLAGWSGLVIAMAQPESGEEWVEVENEGRNILFCIDISRSMLAEDVSPSRLAAARSAALTILEKFPNDRVGVLLFAGEPLVQSPLTIDHSYVEQTLAQLDPNDIPYGGSDLTAAIETGTALLTKTGQNSNIMVVFSDGEKSSEGLTEAAEKAAEAGVFIYALGMGTSKGTFIPDPRERDGRFRDRRGNIVFSQLDESALETLARETEGYYSQGMGGDFLPKLDTALSEMDRFREEGKYQRVAKPAHQWFAAGGIFLLMTSLFVRCLPLRPLVALMAFIVTGLTAPRAAAGVIEDGIAALENGAPAEAHLAFREAARESRGTRAASLHLSAGSAAAQAGNWEAAVDSFSDALAHGASGDDGIQQKASYGLGTSLFYLGLSLDKEAKVKAWKGAIDHFEASLKLLPDDEAARDNLATVKEELRKLDEQELESESEDEKPPSQDKEDEGDGEQDKKEENQEDQRDQDQPKNPDPQDSDQENKEEEQQEEKEQPGQQDPNEQEKEQKDQKEGEGDREDPEKEPTGNQQGEENSPKDRPGGDPQSQKDPPGQPEGELQDDPNAPKNETPEERARRLLRQYADFGAKAPRRTRRPFNRADQDW